MYNPVMTTAYTWVPSPGHAYADHPERPGRLELLLPRLDSFGATRLEAQPAAREQIAAVHDLQLVSALERICRTQAPAIIDHAPTYVTQSSFDDALLAAGGAIGCTRAVLSGEARNGFAIVRPPGHHAETQRPMGFCIFNNIAVAARAALADGMERVMIVDYDAHHGNGTQEVFLQDERVAFLSSHQQGIYPGTGAMEDAPHARQRIVNVPLNAFAGDRIFAEIMDRIVHPMAIAFRPQLMLVSAGFDAHWNDPITSLGLTTAGFFQISKKLVEMAEEFCAGRIVFVLEGGYDPLNVANGAAAVFAALAGAQSGPAADDAFPQREPPQSSRLDDVIKWHRFQ